MLNLQLYQDTELLSEISLKRDLHMLVQVRELNGLLQTLWANPTHINYH